MIRLYAMEKPVLKGPAFMVSVILDNLAEGIIEGEILKGAVMGSSVYSCY